MAAIYVLCVKLRLTQFFKITLESDDHACQKLDAKTHCVRKTHAAARNFHLSPKLSRPDSENRISWEKLGKILPQRLIHVQQRM
ncbi:hypothetical protein HOLleu_45054 [Holothuria leucospilota]|uniref:Uncharacterized protein n=1 Tax=Holothuria leucospilota TaxID=206669 RepID=A0A9Q1B954_HOLLE|nr:hypothetical protein HOLleu_45054 [Holothuria leucospilota]